MRRVEMINNGSGTKGLTELTHHNRFDQKETRDGDTGQMLSEEDESRINENVENIDDGDIELLQQAEVVVLKPQKKSQAPVVRWERFLHVKSLKVLLVENDDSTRHVVSALLRNCSYEVTAVENGLQAWKILEDVTNHIDLVLTEVVMPCLSGLGLLCKIMSHQIRKNIPVIMMSSHDSMGIVFNCLSKGAVDFLVKPIRKNELKTLWQHVWRKCHNSSGSGSGSGSESGVRTQKSAKMISGEDDESDKTGSNNQDDNTSIGLDAQDGSDHGSGTQSSWTKRVVEVDSPQSLSQRNKLVDGLPDNTFAQANHSRAEMLSNNRDSMVPTRKYQGKKDELDNAAMGKHLAAPKNPNQQPQIEGLNKMIINNNAGTHEHNISEIRLNKNNGQFEQVQVGLNEGFDPMMECSKMEASKVSKNNEKTVHDPTEMPSLELSLKLFRDDKDNETNAHERNILRHSHQSAFSRYNSHVTANPPPIRNVDSSYPPLDKSSEATKSAKYNSDDTPPNHYSNGSSNNNNDMGSTTNNAFTKPLLALHDNSPVKIVTPSSAFQPLQNCHNIFPVQPTVPTTKPNATTTDTVQVHHRHHHYHHYHHHAVPINGNSSNNHSLNGSGSGSNHGSNGNYVNEGENIKESDMSEQPPSNGGTGSGNGSGSGNKSEIDENYFARREAALNKFRLKRKERCFEKKVRYQSRKKLAEQRPRVRGQFVRQAAKENSIKETDS